MKALLLLPLLVAVALAVEPVEQKINHRNPKLFFVSSSTSTTTTTLSTTSICYRSANAGLTTCGRRRRSIVTDAITGEQVDLMRFVKPTKSDRVDRSVDDEESVDSGKMSLAEKEEKEREARFLLYWATTTSTSTSTTTSYTSTSTLATLNCTPSGFTLSVCGK